MFCDIGQKDRALQSLSYVTCGNLLSQILPKWRELKDHRPDLVQRYAPLFGELFG